MTGRDSKEVKGIGDRACALSAGYPAFGKRESLYTGLLQKSISMSPENSDAKDRDAKGWGTEEWDARGAAGRDAEK